MKINQYELDRGRSYIIAEIGNNHNGDFERAVHMVDRAKAVGADCAKFQMRNLGAIYRKRSLRKDGEDLSTEYTLDLLRRFELSVDEHLKLFNYCNRLNIDYMCTPWDECSVSTLENFGVSAYKVASADLTNLQLINRLAHTKKPLILSTGMSLAEEVHMTARYLNNLSVDYVLLHCNSTYPAPLHDINLNWMTELRKIHRYVGYSGHERGINISLAAVALGACVLERHFTLDRMLEGPDHAASLTEDEFSRLINGVREIELSMGTGEVRRLSQGEMINRENLAKSLVASRRLDAGTVLKLEDIKVRSPGQGLSPQKISELIGCRLSRDMLEEDYFYPTDLTGEKILPRNYKFKRPWGVPVRYHDFNNFAKQTSPDLWEFHLSYSDMELDPNNYLSDTYQSRLVVHAPELFSHGRLMDLASPDPEYRTYSIYEMQRVVDITRAMNVYFPNEERPLIVANVGGFSMDQTLPDYLIPEYYWRFSESLKELDLNGVELIPQTMAPFPWHFGGQRYQNIFVKAEEIIEWCLKLDLRICFDVSHSYLTCNHLGQDFYSFAAKVAPVTAHLHLGDAKGLNGEGLQIGDGDIDFNRLGMVLAGGAPKASFIPEIWQGHKNFGAGFWRALERLEQHF